MRAIIDSTTPFRLLAEYAPDGLRTLNHTGAALYFTVAQIFQVTCTRACIVCGKHGTYLYMPECVRCCQYCLNKTQKLMPISKTDVELAFGLTDKTLRVQNVPVIIGLPRNYTFDQTSAARKRYLVSQRLAREAAIAVHGGGDGLAEFIGRPRANAAYKLHTDRS